MDIHRFFQVASSRRTRASFSPPRTSSAALRMYGVTEIASYRRGDLSPSAPPRTYSAALCMYGVNEIASYRRGASCIN